MSAATGTNNLVATKFIYAGLFFIALTTMMFEILLTRIFSVTMWYHFAFMAVSIAMFGMTLGATVVYVLPKVFVAEKTSYHLWLSSIAFAFSSLASILVHVYLPAFLVGSMSQGALVLITVVITYLVVAVPFTFSGICVCLVLTRFSQSVSKLYSADLAGAALGCILLIGLLTITDAITAVIDLSLLACLGATIFIWNTEFAKQKRLSLICCAVFGVLVVLAGIKSADHHPLITVQMAKFNKDEHLLYEKWNAYSRVSIHGNPTEPQTPFGWALAPNCGDAHQTVNRLDVHIDGNARTVMQRFHGKPEEIAYLKCDLINMAHNLRPNASVLNIGLGGMRDMLSALAFDQKEITGVEINSAILDTDNRVFGDFSGHLDRIPKVKFVNDEARSYVARCGRKFDIIQMSLIDTLAAGAAGAFALSENSLYTVEAWHGFLNHLNPGGVFSVSRWPGEEAYRLASLASESLIESGVQNPQEHMLMGQAGVASTLVISPTPFAKEDIDHFEQLSKDHQFKILITPRTTSDSTFAGIVSAKTLPTFLKNYYLDISAPTDDRPYFFQMLRFKDVFTSRVWSGSTMFAAYGNTLAVIVLFVLITLVLGLTTLGVMVPVFIATDRALLKRTIPLTFYFSFIGFGFMFVEISQMQRLIVLLGHPIYGLSVVLFSLLLSSGVGSFCTQNIRLDHLRKVGSGLIAALIVVLLGLHLITPVIVPMFAGSETPARVAISVLLLLPMGFFMGMAFPLGMKLAAARSRPMTPWLWGINGSTSVCGSVIGVAIALTSGIAATYLAGVACYVGALCAFAATKPPVGEE